MCARTVVGTKDAMVNKEKNNTAVKETEIGVEMGC